MTAAVSHSVTSSVERRHIPFAVTHAGARTIGGYAAVFNSESRQIPGGMGGAFVESILPTFFDEARSAGWPGNQGSGVMCRYNHNDQYLLGTTRAGTCRLAVDRTGLEYRTEVPECRADVLELVTRGDITQSSFTFMDAQDDWNYRGGVTHRTLISGGVLDVAPVSAVAGYADTSCALRSLAAAKGADPEEVRALADRDELRRLFTRSDQPQQRSNQSTRGAPMSYRPQWEIQAENMQRILDLHARQTKWHDQALAEIEAGWRRLRSPRTLSGAEALRINQRRRAWK